MPHAAAEPAVTTTATGRIRDRVCAQTRITATGFFRARAGGAQGRGVRGRTLGRASPVSIPGSDPQETSICHLRLEPRVGSSPSRQTRAPAHCAPVASTS